MPARCGDLGYQRAFHGVDTTHLIIIHPSYTTTRRVVKTLDSQTAAQYTPRTLPPKPHLILVIEGRRESKKCYYRVQFGSR